MILWKDGKILCSLDINIDLDGMSGTKEWYRAAYVV